MNRKERKKNALKGEAITGMYCEVRDVLCKNLSPPHSYNFPQFSQ